MRKTLALTVLGALLSAFIGVAATAGAAGGPPTNPLNPEMMAVLDALEPGEMTTVIVTLSDQADLSAIPGASNAARLRGVIRALQAKALASQVPINAYLSARAAKGEVEASTSFWILNALSVTATANVIDHLAGMPQVASITADEIDAIPEAGPAESNVAVVQAPAMWGLGYTGQGVVVASLDSGVDINHPDLASRWRGGTNSWFDPYGQHPTTPTDLTGHGTGTMGVMVGGDAGGTSIGVAPGAQWIAAKIFNDRGKSNKSAIHAAYQWVLDPDGNVNTADAPQIVNNSWSFGSGTGCNLAFQLDIQALRAAGIIPVFAAGNYGPGSSSSVSPANYPESLAVGAVDNADAIYSGSSRGPSSCGEEPTTYPEVVAPGINIRSAERYGFYQVATGTSMAAPHVAGALALLLSSNPDLTTADAEAALVGSAVDLGAAGPDNTYGYGRIDVAAAYQWLQNPPPPTTTTSTSTTTTSSSTTTTPTTTTTTTTLPTTTTTTPPTTTTTSTPPTTTTTTTPGGGLFSDGFESGTMSAWSQTSTNGGDLSVTSSAALTGSFGMRAIITNTTEMYVADQSPVASVSYGASFGFHPNGTVISNGKLHDLFVGRDSAGTAVFRVQLQSSSGNPQIRGIARDKGGKESSSSWVTITNAPHTLSVGWAASTSSSAKNGTLSVSVDGVQVGTVTGLSNDAYAIEEARLGPQGIGKNIAGTEYFDDFVTLWTN